MKNINCIWNDGTLCKNKKIKRSFFGLGKRYCIEYNTHKKCTLKQLCPKPETIPLPPPRNRLFG